MSNLDVHFSSKSAEHYTPGRVLDLVYQMFDVDLDPCSNSAVTPNVRATNHYTFADDGLTKPWFGTVYMNPPYGRVIGNWTEKLIREYEMDHVTEALALVPARPDTLWFKPLYRFPVCFITGRLKFLGNNDPAPFPSAVVYLGAREWTFNRAFSEIGTIVESVRLAPVQLALA